MSIEDLEDSIFQVSQISDKQIVNVKPKEMNATANFSLKRRQTRIMINEGHKNEKLAFEMSLAKDRQERENFKEKKRQNLLDIMNHTMQLQKQRNSRLTIAGKTIEESMI